MIFKIFDMAVLIIGVNEGVDNLRKLIIFIYILQQNYNYLTAFGMKIIRQTFTPE